MTYFPDLSAFAYHSRNAVPALNIGWLDGVHPFATEPPTNEVLDALWEFVKAPVHRTRGLHECDSCQRDPTLGTGYPHFLVADFALVNRKQLRCRAAFGHRSR